MPHYELDDAAMASLVAYLKQLSPGKVHGVTDSVLHFATIVTPDADPVVRRGVLDVLDKFIADQNHYRRGDAPRLRSSRRMMFKAYRTWQLHVWELSGAPGTWEGQLHARLAAEPVFAVLSGVGGRDWGPVHRFCESESLPCLFPNVDLPVVAEGEFDNLYLSKGVLLEAGLIAQSLDAQHRKAELKRIVQVFRADDVGVQAAHELATRLGQEGLTSGLARPRGPRRAPAGGAQRQAGTPVLRLRPPDRASQSAAMSRWRQHLPGAGPGRRAPVPAMALARAHDVPLRSLTSGMCEWIS
jgi:hypothetical protein